MPVLPVDIEYDKLLTAVTGVRSASIRRTCSTSFYRAATLRRERSSSFSSRASQRPARDWSMPSRSRARRPRLVHMIYCEGKWVGRCHQRKYSAHNFGASGLVGVSPRWCGSDRPTSLRRSLDSATLPCAASRGLGTGPSRSGTTFWTTYLSRMNSYTGTIVVTRYHAKPSQICRT